MTGKVDITNTKTYKQLQAENKDKELKIQFLTKKYVKKQQRIDYNLRLPQGNNKSDEHEVFYYQDCSDEEKMGIAEGMVFNKLKEYREQANRERFILSENKDIEYFKDTIKKAIEFINQI